MKKVTIVHIGSSEWFNYKEEIIFGLYHALRSVGHDVQIKHNQVDGNTINIIIGGDWLSQDEKFQQFIESKIQYYIFEVENFDGTTINNRNGFNLINYSIMIEKSIGIITPYLYNIKTLSQLNVIDSKRIQYLKWGFNEQCIDKNITRNQSRSLLGTFFGLLKGSRLAKAKTLESIFTNRIKFLGREQPHAYRAAVLSNSHYAISLAYGEDEKFVNPFRLYYLLGNGINVLSDNTQDDDGYLELCLKTSTDNFSVELLKTPPNEVELMEHTKTHSLEKNVKNIMI
jgi:hypothetical protein